MPDYTTVYSREHHKQYKSAAYRLFHFTYPALVPEYYFHSDWDMSIKGYGITGVGMVDEGALFRKRESNVFPSFLAMVVGNGGNIDLLDIQDVIMIYDDIVEHLSDWNRYVDYRLGAVSNCPIDELKWFEQLAMDLHPHVDAYRRHHQNRDSVAGRYILNGRRGHLSARPASLYIPVAPIIERRIRDNQYVDKVKPKQGLLGEFKTRS